MPNAPKAPMVGTTLSNFSGYKRPKVHRCSLLKIICICWNDFNYRWRSYHNSFTTVRRLQSRRIRQTVSDTSYTALMRCRPLPVILQRLSTLQCLTGDVSFNGWGRFSRACRLKIFWPMRTRFGTNDERETCQNSMTLLQGFAFQMWWTCSFWCSLWAYIFGKTYELRILIG